MTKIYNTIQELYDDAIKESDKKGLYLEFGVYKGKSLNNFAKMTPDLKWYGFDSFEGNPERWREGFEMGVFYCGEPPKVENNVELVTGLFQESLEPFIKNHSENVSFIHIDCDLYSSSKYVLSTLKDKIVSGTIVVFDELGGYDGYEAHEYRAFKQFIKETGKKYECLGHHAYVQYLVKFL